jgi:hypothetical protein
MSTPDPTIELRPTVEDVAGLLRARTKDSTGHELGTFTDDTRPTDVEVEAQIDAAMGLMATHIPDPEFLPEAYWPAVRELTAYRAAMRIEKSYFPEQVRSDRSAYEQLRQEYVDDLQALTDALAGAGDPDDPGYGSAGHRAHSEWTPTFLYASQYGMPVWDWWPEPENPENWRASPFQPPREPPHPEDLPVGVEPASGLWEAGDVENSESRGVWLPSTPPEDEPA